MGIQEGEESEQGIEILFEEIMTENFPNLVKEKNMKIQEVHRESQTRWTQKGLCQNTS